MKIGNIGGGAFHYFDKFFLGIRKGFLYFRFCHSDIICIHLPFIKFFCIGKERGITFFLDFINDFRHGKFIFCIIAGTSFQKTRQQVLLCLRR